MFIELLRHAAPKAGRSSRSNRNAALLFLLHPIHNRGTVVHFTDLMGQAGIKKYTLSGRGLACIYMGDDAYIAVATDRRGTRHTQCFELVGVSLVAVVSKRLVRISHTVSVFTLLNCRAAAFRRIQKFSGEPSRH